MFVSFQAREPFQLPPKVEVIAPPQPPKIAEPSAGKRRVFRVGGEVEMTHRLTDRVYRVKTQKDGEEESFLVHLEFESSYNPRMGRRLGMYGWGLYEKEELPVMHIVWQVGVDAPSYWPEGAWQRRCEETMVLQGELHASVRWREVWLPGGYDAEAFAKQAPTYAPVTTPSNPPDK